MKYYKIHRDDLRHDEGEEREDHKYVARVETGDPKYKYRYFYTNESYQAYLKSRNSVKRPLPVAKKEEQPKQSSMFDKILSAAANTASNIFNTGKDYVENFIKPSTETVNAPKPTISSGEKATFAGYTVGQVGRYLAIKTLNNRRV